MAKFPTIEEMARNVAEKALNEYEYKGKTLRQWIEIIASNDSDTISRKAAIKDAESWVAVDEYEKHLQKNVVEWLKEFPSAQLGTNLSEVSTDCISRQAAIDAVRTVIGDNRSISVCEAIEKLPPAEPQRIRAKWIATTALQEGQITWRDYKCSNCSHHRGKPMNFCEVCGAKMERRRNERNCERHDN